MIITLLGFSLAIIVIMVVFGICGDISLRGVILSIMIPLSFIVIVFRTAEEKIISVQKIIALEDVYMKDKIYYIVTTENSKLILKDIKCVQNGRMELELYKINCVFGEIGRQYKINR